MLDNHLDTSSSEGEKKESTGEAPASPVKMTN